MINTPITFVLVVAAFPVAFITYKKFGVRKAVDVMEFLALIMVGWVIFVDLFETANAGAVVSQMRLLVSGFLLSAVWFNFRVIRRYLL